VQDEVYYSTETPNTYEDRLLYARINGVEYGTPVSVEEASPPAPQQTALLGIYPNPASVSATTITVRYSIAGNSAAARITLHDALGRMLRTIPVDGTDIGMHDLQIENGGLSPGVYYCRLLTNDATTSRRLIIISR
jgi:hypothetical protein